MVKYKNEYDVANYYTKLIRVYMDGNEVISVSRINLEFIRRINKLLDDFNSFKQIMLVVANMMMLDDSLGNYIGRKKKSDAIKIVTSLNKQRSYLESLKKSLKVRGINDPNLVKAITYSLKNCESRITRLHSTMITEYVLITKWRDYAQVIKDKELTWRDDMTSVIPSLFDRVYDTELSIDEYYTEYATKYIEHIESIIDVTLYDVNENKERAHVIKHIEQNLEDKQRIKDEKRVKITNHLNEDFENFANKLQYTLNKKNLNNWLSKEDYDILMKKAKSLMRDRYDVTCYFAVFYKQYKSKAGGKIYFMDSKACATGSVNNIYLVDKLEKLPVYDLESKGYPYRVISFDFNYLG